MGKLVDIRNDRQEKAFELHSETDALYFNVKCSDNKNHSRIVSIKVSDVVYQIAKVVSPEQWQSVCRKASIE